MTIPLARIAALATLLLVSALVASPASATEDSKRSMPAQRILAAAPSSIAASAATRLRALERRVLRRLNAYRAKHGRRPLRTQKQLRRAALVHAREMARKGFFAHESGNGESFDTRIRRYYDVAGHRSWTVGENLLWASGKLTARRAIALWHGSPGHRRNMRERGWRQIGVAALRVRSAPGVFRGFDVTIVVTDFGSRS